MRKKNKKSIKFEQLITDESFTLNKAKGNGILKRQIWCDQNGRVTRYSLAYVNLNHHSGDNGRVLGFDNAHGYHHKHYMGKVEPVDFDNFSNIEERFQKEFEVIYEKFKKK